MCMENLKDKVYPLIKQTFLNFEEELQNYENYIHAYCVELKLTEFDILKSEKLFIETFNIFKEISLSKAKNG